MHTVTIKVSRRYPFFYEVSEASKVTVSMLLWSTPPAAGWLLLPNIMFKLLLTS